MRAAIRIVLALLVWGLCVAGLLALAGRADWWQGWLYIGLLTTVQLGIALVLWRRNPELLDRRARIGAGTPRWDVMCLSGFGVLFLAALVVAALDSGRYGWSPLPAWVSGAGCLLYVASAGFLGWAMVVNRHFEKTVRLQDDLGHRVIDTGPYQYVRHPGYVGVILGLLLAAPLTLGSGWALLPAGLSSVVLVVRTALEDHFLHRHLDGYAAYATRVRYRLVPGLW
jgi:protein-S-isoprenylcysteine O-methyltransferase Ste14